MHWYQVQGCHLKSFILKCNIHHLRSPDSITLYVLCLVTSVVFDSLGPMDCSPPGSSVHGESPGKNSGVGCHALLREIFPTQGLNPGLPHCRQIFYHLSHQGSPRILDWVACPFSRGSSQHRN